MPKIVLERHAYAPELNRAHILHKGRPVAVLPCPGALSTREARAALFRPHAPGIWACVKVTRPDPWQGLNREYSGRVTSRAAGLYTARGLIAGQHRGGPLLDGRTLPDAQISVSFRLI